MCQGSLAAPKIAPVLQLLRAACRHQCRAEEEVLPCLWRPRRGRSGNPTEFPAMARSEGSPAAPGDVTPWQRWETQGLGCRHGCGAVVLLQTPLLCLPAGLSALRGILCQRQRGIRDRNLTTLCSYWMPKPARPPLQINPNFQLALKTAPAESPCVQPLPGDLVQSPLWPLPRRTEGWERLEPQEHREVKPQGCFYPYGDDSQT